MTIRIEVGWDHAVIGTASIYVTEATGPLSFTASITSGTHCHTGLNSVLGSGNYTAFSAALKTALDTASAASGNTWTYTVSYTSTTGAYTISAGGGNTALDFSTPGTAGTVARQILGFSGNSSSAASHASDVGLYYRVDPANAAVSNPTDDYEPGNVAEGAEADDGTQYAIHRTAAAVYSDFDITSEAKAATFKRSAVAATPWTYQHLWEHARARTPFLVTDDSDQTIHYLRPDGASWKPNRTVPNYDDLWDLRFSTIVEGRL